MAKEKIPYGVYSREFREEAVKLVIENGFSVRQVGVQLSIPSTTIRYWVKAHKKGDSHRWGRRRRPSRKQSWNWHG